MKRICVFLLLLLGMSGMLYAAPVGLTSEADSVSGNEIIKGSDVELSMGVITDFITEKKVDIDSGEFEMAAYMLRIGLSYLDRYNLYLDIGETDEMEFRYVLQGEKNVVEFTGDTIWGIGLSGLIYRWENGIEIGASASYREAEMTLTKATIDSAVWEKRTLNSIRNDKYQEFQVAGELAWKTELITPYIGVKYSDAELGSDFTIGGVSRRNTSSSNAAENVGIFLGFTLTPKTNMIEEVCRLSINVEGRLIDEEAFNIGISYRF